MSLRKSILPAVWEIPAVFHDRLGAQAGKQRAMVHDGHLLLVLHAPPKPDQPDRAGRFFWRAPDGTWSSSEFGKGTSAVTRHLDELQARVADLEQKDANAKVSKDHHDILQLATPLQRAARNLHHALQEARDALPNVRELIDFRDKAYQLERNLDLLVADAKNALEYATARRSEEQAISGFKMAMETQRLNRLAAFFFPIATLSSIFGMNLLHGYEAAPGPLPFLVVLGIGLGLGAAVATAFR